MRDSRGHLDYVDALRGLAIVMVVLPHTAESVPGLSPFVAAVAASGQMGVQLFFVASAYTLCVMSARRAGEPLPVLSFFIRRFFRIAPLYYLGIALYFAMHLGDQALAHAHAAITVAPYTLRNVLANVAFVHGFVPAANNNIVPGGWSIGTEMAFYLIFPQLFAAFAWLASRNVRWTLTACAAALLANVAFQVALARFTPHFIHNDNFTYFSLINQLPVFLLGMHAYFQLATDTPPWWLDSRAVQGTMLLVFLALAAWLWEAEPSLAFAVIPTACGVAFVGLLHLARLYSGSLATFASIGRVSYSMYIFHFLFARYLTRAVAGHLTLVLPPVVALVVAFAGSVGISFALARFSERWIESKGIALGARLIRRLQAPSVALRAHSPAAGTPG